MYSKRGYLQIKLGTVRIASVTNVKSNRQLKKAVDAYIALIVVMVHIGIVVLDQNWRNNSMPKYRKKPIVVDAEVYHKGMEDGFMLYWSDRWDNFEKSFKSMALLENHANLLEAKSCYNDDLILEKPEPFIKTSRGKLTVLKGYFIITDKSGSKSVMSPEDFHATYEYWQVDDKYEDMMREYYHEEEED
jgi:hypothetical protein